MLSFKFKYLTRPSNAYKIKYGLESKSLPYKFNYPIGLSNGKYMFRYDRRNEIFIEKDPGPFVRFGSELYKFKNDNIFIKKLDEIVIDKETILNKEFNSSLFKSSEVVLKKPNIKHLEKEKFVLLNFINEKSMFIEEEKILIKNNLKDLIIEITNLLLKLNKEKKLEIDNKNYLLDSSIKPLFKDVDINTLERIKNSIQKEYERILTKCHIFSLEKDVALNDLIKNYKKDFFYNRNEILLYLNKIKSSLIDAEEYKINKIFLKGITKDIKGFVLIKEETKEIILKVTFLLNKISNNFTKEESVNLYRIIRETYKEKELATNILFLYAVYELEKDIKDKDLHETIKGNILKEKLNDLEKDYKKDGFKDSKIKEIEKLVIKEILEELKVIIFRKITKHEIDLENYKLLEKFVEKLVEVENDFETFDREILKELYQEKDLEGLIKKFIVRELITENEMKQLKKLPIGNILLDIIKELEKVSYLDINIEKEKNLNTSAYREIMKNKVSLDTVRKLIVIDKDKEKELKIALKEFETQYIDGKTVDLYKRFWFIRATDPKDWKILPYSDYPYEEKPLYFGNELIPDNWQLEMIPSLYKEIKEHPIPFGSDLGLKEMELSINIMIEVINILILIWSRLYYDFTGYTGSQAVIRLTQTLYDWLMLETSLEEMERKGSREHYFRCYRWIRWEAEKVSIKAKDDMNLNGNNYISELIFELIYYMENHHFDTTPLFYAVEKMDEFRALIPSDEPQGNINFILDKVKGIRHRIIECRSKKSNE